MHGKPRPRCSTPDLSTRMYYDDQARRFNFASGLLLGAALGAGLALVLATQDRVRGAASLARSGRPVRRGAKRARRALQHALAQGRNHLNPYAR